MGKLALTRQRDNRRADDCLEEHLSHHAQRAGGIADPQHALLGPLFHGGAGVRAHAARLLRGRLQVSARAYLADGSVAAAHDTVLRLPPLPAALGPEGLLVY